MTYGRQDLPPEDAPYGFDMEGASPPPDEEIVDPLAGVLAGPLSPAERLIVGVVTPVLVGWSEGGLTLGEAIRLVVYGLGLEQAGWYSPEVGLFWRSQPEIHDTEPVYRLGVPDLPRTDASAEPVE